MTPAIFRRAVLKFVLLLSLAVAPVFARVTRVEISSRAIVLDGKSFGDAGPYERITGRIFFSVVVDNLHNKSIVDLANAVNLQNGEVEFSADFVAVRPIADFRESCRSLTAGKKISPTTPAMPGSFAAVTRLSLSVGNGTRPAKALFICTRPSPKTTARPSPVFSAVMSCSRRMLWKFPSAT
jgi:hypothetical protein